MADMGQNVGKINIKVVPDTSKFKETLQGRLNSIEKTVRKVRIEARLDDRVLRLQIRKSIKEINTELRTKDHLKIKFRSKFEDGDAIRQINTTAQNLQKYAREGVKINPKIDREKWREAKNWLARWQRDISPMDIEVRPSMLTGAASYVNARLAVLTRPRTVQIAPVINGASYKKAVAAIAALSGVRTVNKFASDFLDFVGGLDKALPRIAAFSTALINLGSYLMVATSNTLSFIASLGPMFNTLLALPGILGGVAVGLGASFAVLKDFNKVLPEVGKKFHALQDSMSVRFWNRAKQPFQDFIDDIFPHFQKGIEATSDKLGTFFSALAKNARGAFDGELDQMFRDLNYSIDRASQHTASFVGILSKLGKFGSKQLPVFASWVGKIADEFDRWLFKNDQNGNLQKWLDEGVKTLQDFGGLLSAVGSAFSGLARAAEAAGGSTLRMARDTMESVATTINSARFQKAFTAAFRGAHEGMSEIANKSGPQFRSFILRLSNTLSKSLPVAGRVAGKALGAIFKGLDTDNVQNTFIGVLRSLERAVDDLAPAVGPMIEAFAGIARAAAQVGESIARNLAPVLEKLGPKIASLADDLHPLIDALGSGLGAALNAVATVLGAIPNLLLIVGAGFVALSVGMRTASAGTGALSAATTKLSLGIWHMWPVLKQIPTYLYRWGQGASQASAATLAARKAIGPLAAKVAGAATQMGALALVSSGAANNMGMTNTVTLGLMGSMFGLAGAVTGAAVGAFIDLKSAVGEFSKPFKDLRKQLQENSSAFDVNNKAVEEAIAKADNMLAAEDRLREKGFVPKLKYLFLTKQGHHDYIAGLTGGKSAAEKAGDAAFKYAMQLQRQRDAVTDLGQALGLKYNTAMSSVKQITESTRPAMEALGLTFESISKMDMSAQAAAFEDIRAWMSNADSDAGRIDTLRESLELIGGDMLTAKDAADQFRTAMNNLINPALEMEANTDRWRTSLQGLSESLTTGAGFTSATSAAAIQNRELTRTLAEQTIQMLASTAEATKNKDVMVARFSEFITGMYAEADAAKVSRTAIAERIRTMGFTPDRVRTIFEQAGFEVTDAQINDLLNGVKSVEKTPVKVKVAPESITSLEATKKLVNGAGNWIKQRFEQATTKLQMNGMKDSAVKGVNAAGKAGAEAARAAGGNISGGLAGGIRGGRSGVISAAVEVAQSAIAAARNALDIHSPSRVFRQIGAYTAEGFAEGISGGTAGVISKMDRLIGMLRKTGRKGLVKLAQETKADLLKIAKQWEKLTERINQIQQYVDQVKQNIVNSGSPVEVNGGTFADVVANLKGAVKDAQAFAAVMIKLRNLGLNKTTIDQLMQAGPEAALAAAQSIANAGQAGVNQINQLQSQLTNAAGTAANAAADVMFSNGKHIVHGLLAGLKAQRKDLERAMENMAEALVRVIRRKLGIHSPSRVFKTLGDHIGTGFVKGIEGQQKNAKSAILGLAEARPSSALDYAVSRGLRTQAINQSNKTINYYAADGKSLSSEEELFAAMGRARSF